MVKILPVTRIAVNLPTTLVSLLLRQLILGSDSQTYLQMRKINAQMIKEISPLDSLVRQHIEDHPFKNPLVTAVRPIICYSKRLLKIENKMIPKDWYENKQTSLENKKVRDISYVFLKPRNPVFELTENG